VLPSHAVRYPAPCRLQDVAAAGKQGGWSEQKLQRRLLDQLQPEVSKLQPEELLAEFKALQVSS
jgi:hypothetical protein